MPERPNIVYIHSHDTGRLIQPYGAPVPTPNLQRLADEGLVFRNTFCASPSCSPSRAAMLSGRYPHTNGLIGLTHRGFRMQSLEGHLARFLRDNGYRNALCGIQHEGPPDEMSEQVYEIFNKTHHDTAATTAAANDFLEEHAGKGSPFFLSVGFFETHRPFPPATPAYSGDRSSSFPGYPDTPELRADTADFRTMAGRLDDAIGSVLASLDRSGVADNTIVICTTDHGPAAPFMKCNLTDAGMGVFLILRGPGGFSGGRVLDSLVSQLDLYPTLCELLDFQPPKGLQGVSFMPLVRGEQHEVRDRVFAEVNFHVAYDPQRCVRTKRWKYVRRYGEWPHPVLPNIDASRSKTWFLENGLRERELPRDALYDLFYDPGEACNLAGQPECREIHEELGKSLDQWMEETDDSLRHGPIPPPDGARLDPPDHYVP